MNQETVLVTGSKGFIGHHLVSDLRNRGFSVLEFDRCDGDIVTMDFRFPHIDHIIHLASLVYVPMSWEDPYPFYRTNVMGTVNILELCRKKGCKLTYVSSYIYGAPRYLPVNESQPVDPASPYNHSKFLAEEACRFYAGTYHVPVVIFRPINIYGPGQHPNFLIPTIINQVVNPDLEQVEVIDLRPRRDYLFITDFTDALIRSFTLEGFNLFNIGAGKSFSVEEIVLTVMQQAGIRKEYLATGKERPHEIWDVYADIRKFSGMTGWEPTTSIDQGIRKSLPGASDKS